MKLLREKFLSFQTGVGGAAACAHTPTYAEKRSCTLYWGQMLGQVRMPAILSDLCYFFDHPHKSGILSSIFLSC